MKPNYLKTIIAVAVLSFSCLFTNAQDKFAGSYLCQKGMIHFFSATAMENIDATSNTAMCILNTTAKRVLCKVKQTSFNFKDHLMQDHFNENYMESEKYPMAVLDMNIVENIDYTKDGTYDVTLKGTLEMHGVKKEREIKAQIVVKGGVPVSATAVFMVKLADHNIKIPSVVGANIAEDVKVNIDFAFEKFHN